MPGAFLLPKFTWPDGQIYRKEHLHVQLIPKENIQRAREMDLLIVRPRLPLLMSALKNQAKPVSTSPRTLLLGA